MNCNTYESDETAPIADVSLAYAQQHHIARLTFRSTNRDRQCGGSSTDCD
jgi:hypothetical protein